MSSKIIFMGNITSIQPRIRLLRSFDDRHHNYLGYVLRINGIIGEESQEFNIAIGKGAHEKHKLKTGQKICGECLPVENPQLQLETAKYYKVSKFKKLNQAKSISYSPPPWLGIPEPLPVYRERGHRRLFSVIYDKCCTSCIWGCRMAVEINVDHWNPHLKKYRYETFCYGPKSCSIYKAGPKRKVPGRKGTSYEEPDWVDEEEISHRGPDD